MAKSEWRLGRPGRREKPKRNSSVRGEWRGWGLVVVLAAHLNIVFTDGLLRDISVLFLSWREEFETSARATAAVSSVMTSMYCASILLGGVMSKHFGCRPTAILGAILMSGGLLSNYWVKEIYQLYITSAVIGMGQGLAMNAVSVAVAIYFKRQFKTAYAVAYAGGGVGGMAIPPLLQLLQETYGWRGSLLVMSVIVANLIGLNALFRPPRGKRFSPTKYTLQVQRRRSLDECEPDGLNTGHDDLSVSNTNSREVGASSGRGQANMTPDKTLTEITSLQTSSESKKLTRPLRRVANAVGLDLFIGSYRFSLVCLMLMECSSAVYGFSLFVIPHAESSGVAPSTAVTLLSLFGLGLLLGRLGNALMVSWRLSAETVSALCLLVAGVSLLLMNVDSFVCMAVACFLEGYTIGAIFTTFFVLIRHYVGVDRFGVAFGLTNVSCGIGALCGPLLSGLLYDVTSSYTTVFYVLAGLFFVCVLQSLLFPLLKRLEPGVETDERR